MPIITKEYVSADAAIHPVKASLLDATLINSFPRTGAAIIKHGDGIAFYTGKYLVRKPEIVYGNPGDYLVTFHDGSNTIISKLLFERLYKEKPDVVTEIVQVESKPKTNKKGEIKEDGKSSISSAPATGVSVSNTDGGGNSGNAARDSSGTSGVPTGPNTGKDGTLSPTVGGVAAGGASGSAPQSPNSSEQGKP